MTKAISEGIEWSVSQDPPSKSEVTRPSINKDHILDPDRIYMYTDAAWNRSMECVGLGWIIDDEGSSPSFVTLHASYCGNFSNLCSQS